MNVAWLTTLPVWTALGWTMLHLLWVGAAIGLASAMGRRLLRRARPESRYGVALACLLILAAAPGIIFALVYEPRFPPAAVTVRPDATSQSGQPTAIAFPEPVSGTHPGHNVSPLATTEHAGRSRLDKLVSCLPGIWLGGSMLTMAALATGLVGVERLRRSGQFLNDGDIPLRCRELAGSLGVARRVGVGICDRLAAPVFLGVVRPLILLPPAALTGWSVDQVEMILLHELAHLRRCDNVVNLGQRLIEALLFFHPVTWWISAWVRLERELCCDRIVVERTGRPRAYVEMLVALAGPGQGERRVALAMAGGQVSTRVRRILNLEERSMRLTLPEGLGMVGAAIVAGLLMLGSYAAPPQEKPKADEAARQALRKAADDVVALRVEKKAEPNRLLTLISIARSQFEMNDRPAALVTLAKSFAAADGLVPKTDEDWSCLLELTEVASLQRKAGDPAAARASLERLTRLLGTYKANSKPNEVVQTAGQDGPRLSPGDEQAEFLCGALAQLAEQRIALGDVEEAQALIRRGSEVLPPGQGWMKAACLAEFSTRLLKMGDVSGSRDMLGKARQAYDGVATVKERAWALEAVAGAMAQSGDPDGALALMWAGEKPGQRELWWFVTQTYAELDQRHAIWDDPGGIKILIGAAGYKVKDREAARRDLPKVAHVVQGKADPLVKARVLSAIAHLQAQAGDIRGALETAGAIPALRRSEFAGPADGSYDAIKPATLGIVAGAQAASGDKAGAAVTFRRAQEQARILENDGEKVIALIVISREQAESGDKAAARATVADALPAALKLAEPRRSRSLAMLAHRLVKANDIPGASRTADAIRDYPASQKFRALMVIAHAHDTAGDHADYQTVLRRALAVVEAKPPKDPKMGPVRRLTSIGMDTYIDPDYEADAWLQANLATMPVTLRWSLGDRVGAMRALQSLPAGQHGQAVALLASDLARRGDIPAAFDLAATADSPQGRLSAIGSAATMIHYRNESW
jgi:beta-lactamase regulating signal transducer with metallopeptidase domain